MLRKRLQLLWLCALLWYLGYQANSELSFIICHRDHSSMLSISFCNSKPLGSMKDNDRLHTFTTSSIFFHSNHQGAYYSLIQNSLYPHRLIKIRLEFIILITSTQAPLWLLVKTKLFNNSRKFGWG